MATWVTHLMIADKVLESLPQLDARAFCVGNIAPDCNVENADWTAFDPPREVTHFMGSERKNGTEAERFWTEYVQTHAESMGSAQEFSFMLGYYAHLIADAQFQKMIRDEARVAAVGDRIKAHPAWAQKAEGLDKTWDAAKKLLSKKQLTREISALEAEYLAGNPESGYLKHIVPLTEFPEYLDFMPKGCIARKVRVMGGIPQAHQTEFFSISREEYADYVERTVKLTIQSLHNKM